MLQIVAFCERCMHCFNLKKRRRREMWRFALVMALCFFVDGQHERDAKHEAWDGHFESRRFAQRYRVREGKIWTESEVTSCIFFSVLSVGSLFHIVLMLGHGQRCAKSCLARASGRLELVDGWISLWQC
jgi:hypothetical protein